jgi:hypothetical protein
VILLDLSLVRLITAKYWLVCNSVLVLYQFSVCTHRRRLTHADMSDSIPNPSDASMSAASDNPLQKYRGVNVHDSAAVQSLIGDLETEGLNVNTQEGINGDTLLFKAAECGAIETLKHLLKHKDIDVNIRTLLTSETALMVATHDATELLLEHVDIEIDLQRKLGIDDFARRS